jgi:hypothetical protein
MDESQHGTYAGFQSHKREGSRPCDLCMHARNIYTRQYRASRPVAQSREQRRNNLRSRAKTILAERHPNELAAIIQALRDE